MLAQSYTIGLYGAAAGLSIYGVMLLVFARETIPAEVTAAASSLRDQLQGYWQALRDKPSSAGQRLYPGADDHVVDLGAAIGLCQDGFGISEQRYGWLATTNA